MTQGHVNFLVFVYCIGAFICTFQETQYILYAVFFYITLFFQDWFLPLEAVRLKKDALASFLSRKVGCVDKYINQLQLNFPFEIVNAIFSRLGVPGWFYKQLYY